MLIRVCETTGEVSKVADRERDPLLCIADRLEEELAGWLSYRELSEGKEGTYQTISVQEFQHALVALSDLVANMSDRMSTAEKIEWEKFRAEVLAK